MEVDGLGSIATTVALASLMTVRGCSLMEILTLAGLSWTVFPFELGISSCSLVHRMFGKSWTPHRRNRNLICSACSYKGL